MPETRPDLHIAEDGVCDACKNYASRPSIDWAARHNELLGILDRYRVQDGSNYDCIVPVSGGKDSHFQVIKMKELGLNPLCINAHPPDTPEIGRSNIENLKRLGVDFFEVSINPAIWATMARIGLTQVGDISWPEHVAIFTIPVRISCQLNIPLLIWGENSQFEYGGPAAAARNNVLDRRWLEEFGGLLGLRVTDLIGQEGIEKRDIIQLTYPNDEELKLVGVTGLFLGHYLPWDGENNAMIAQDHGFKTPSELVEQQMVNYENIDNHHNGIHEYFMYLKYGFGRVTTQASILIRHGKLSREEAVDLVRKRDGKYPEAYLGKSLDEILDFIELTREQFDSVCDLFTNKKIFQTDNKGGVIKDGAGRPVLLNSLE